jgi:hypothetical protein
MTFYIDSFFFLHFWSAAINILIFWELLRLYNASERPTKVTRNYWIFKSIRVLPRVGRWAEISDRLRSLTARERGYPTFTYRGLVEFLIVAEDVIDHLGVGEAVRREAALMLIHNLLIEPARRLTLPSTLVERNRFEARQIEALSEELPVVRQCRRVAKFWFKWVEDRGLDYPRCIEGTWTRIWELVALIPGEENAGTAYLALLLAPPPVPPPPGVIQAPSLPPMTFSSEDPNSVYDSAQEESDG